MDRDKLGVEEYAMHIYENISKIIVNNNYIEENKEFFEKLIFKMFEDYSKSYLEPISITKQLKLLEMFLYVMIETKPTQELPEDYL